MTMYVNYKAFFHPKGQGGQSQEYSEYEVESVLNLKILAAVNAKIFETKNLQIRDESKPAYFIMPTNAEIAIWKVDNHTVSDGQPCRMVSIKPVFSNEAGAIIYQHFNSSREFVYTSLRRNNETYYAGNVSGLDGEIRQISFDDMLPFIAGELSWEALRGRSYLFERKIKKEILREERIRTLNKSLKEEKSRNEMFQTQLNMFGNDIKIAEFERDEYKKKLAKVPGWIKLIFSAL